jgi:hypothetical protein
MIFISRQAWLGLWPLPSPHVTPPDFFLQVFLKERVYLINPQSLEELNIEQTVVNPDPETLCRVTQKVLKRVDACLQEGGGHFQLL